MLKSIINFFRGLTFRANVLWYITLLHAVWGTMILNSAVVLGSTPLAFLAILMPNHIVLGCTLLGAAAVAMIGLWSKPSIYRVFAFLPQQLLLLTSAISGAVAASRGIYADGTIRPPAFIFADQFPIILAAVFYVFAVLGENGHASSGSPTN